MAAERTRSIRGLLVAGSSAHRRDQSSRRHGDAARVFRSRLASCVRQLANNIRFAQRPGSIVEASADWLPAECAAARRRASAQIDGEISFPAAAALSQHLANCAGCTIWSTDVHAFVHELRGARTESPAAPIRLSAPTKCRTNSAVVAAIAMSAAVAIIVLSPQVEGRRSATPPLDSGAARQVLSLKEYQLELMDLVSYSSLAPRPSRLLFDLRTGPENR